jgi:AGZA family xanthine/uracil permease-like MFS transporter
MFRPPGAQPLFVAGDIDGFFGIAIDNIIQFLLVLMLCTGVLGFSSDLILGTILPACALSIILGNVFYAWQAQKLSAKEGRTDVTALPYGLNTVSLFAYVFLVMMPVKFAALAKGMSEEAACTTAWQIGLAACLVSGLIELFGSLVAEKLRRVTPRAALLSTLAGIAISFIAIDFAIKTFATPLVALLPFGVILTTYFSNAKMPGGVPGGAVAVTLGTAAAWLMAALGETSPVSLEALRNSSDGLSFYVPVPVIGDMIAGLTHEMTADFFLPVMVPMGLFNVLGSLQNIESAEATGDSFETRSSLAVNGAGSVVAAIFGSCFPTTIYIGHPGWKALGARAGYSILNAVFFGIVALFGLTSVISAVVPIEAGMAIVLWIGIVIAAQAFQATPREHAPAVALGLFPAIAAWGALIVTMTLAAANFTTGNMGLASEVLQNPNAFAMAGLSLSGLTAISAGFMITCLVWSAIGAHLIDHNFRSAAIWAMVGAASAFLGFIHTGVLTPAGVVPDISLASGWRWAVGYALCALFFALVGSRTKKPVDVAA